MLLSWLARSGEAQRGRRDLAISWQTVNASRNHRTSTVRPCFAIKSLGSIPITVQRCKPEKENQKVISLFFHRHNNYTKIQKYLCVDIGGDNIIEIDHSRALSLAEPQ